MKVNDANTSADAVIFTAAAILYPITKKEIQEID